MVNPIKTMLKVSKATSRVVQTEARPVMVDPEV